MKCINIGEDEKYIPCHYIYEDGHITYREDCNHVDDEGNWIGDI